MRWGFGPLLPTCLAKPANPSRALPFVFYLATVVQTPLMKEFSVQRVIGYVTSFCFLVAVVAAFSGVRAAEGTSPADKAPDPAPKIDRVGFPTGYREKFEVLRTKVDKEKLKVVTVYGNSKAASVTNLSQMPYPNGSVLVMETAEAEKDVLGKPVLNAQGGLSAGKVLGMHVMRRGAGFGEAYGDKRSGEWEYVEYKADGTYITPPEKSAACSACHIKAGEKRDFVYHGRFAE